MNGSGASFEINRPSSIAKEKQLTVDVKSDGATSKKLWQVDSLNESIIRAQMNCQKADEDAKDIDLEYLEMQEQLDFTNFDNPVPMLAELKPQIKT